MWDLQPNSYKFLTLVLLFLTLVLLLGFFLQNTLIQFITRANLFKKL